MSADSSASDKHPSGVTRLDSVIARWWSLSALLLVAATWPLWTSVRTPPRLPAFEWATLFPPAIDYLLLSGLIGAAVAALLRPTRARWLGAATGCLAGLMLLDQLRWQPWAYQLLLAGTAVVALPMASARWWLRLLTISIYLYSAAAKLDVVFANTMGQQIILALANLVGVNAEAAPESIRLPLALALPVVEAVVGLLLLWSRTRKAAVTAAVGLHLAITIALSPLGLGHRPAVLMWNLLFATLVWRLFWRSESTEQLAPQFSFFAIGARVALTVALVAPLSHPLGVWDRWPSWGLYAPRGERIEMCVHDRVADRLPAELPLDEPANGDRWRRVRLDDWLLEETAAPLYPQNRVGIALAMALSDRARLGSYLRVEIASTADRINGERQRTTLEGSDAVRNYIESRYWLNTSPRWTR